MINGNYYGLYVVEEDLGRGVIQQFFPNNSRRRSLGGRREPGDRTR